MSRSTEQQNLISGYFSQWFELWDRFWFTPRDARMLGLFRIIVGLMLIYTHAVWSLELETFFGNDAVLPKEYRAGLVPGQSFLWSHFDWVGQGALWPVHILGLLIFAAFTCGFQTRVTGVLSALLVISYANRTTGAQFGLDQINAFMAMYLAIGPSGQQFSLDRWLNKTDKAPSESVGANLAIRLIQVHLCLVYLFAGMGKLQGEYWWNGEAIWGAIANLEYQTIDLTFLAEHMWLVNIITFTALTWEVAYPFLVWPRLTRPLFVGMAMLVHLGIGLCMGMMTFGLIMAIANLAFVPPSWLDWRKPSS